MALGMRRVVDVVAESRLKVGRGGVVGVEAEASVGRTLSAAISMWVAEGAGMGSVIVTLSVGVVAAVDGAMDSGRALEVKDEMTMPWTWIGSGTLCLRGIEEGGARGSVMGGSWGGGM